MDHSKRDAPRLAVVFCLLFWNTAAAQDVESIFMSGQNAEGYYVANSAAAVQVG